MREERTGTLWLWAFAPINASIGIFFTLLPLHILNLGGNVVDVGIITSAYLLSLVPAALIWGYAIDCYPHRKNYIVFAYLGMAVALALVYLFDSQTYLAFFLVLYGFVSAASGPAVSLLIMESFAKSLWPSMITKLSFTSLVGYDVGLIIGVVWTSFFDLRGLIALSALMSLFSGMLVMRLVKEPKLSFERKSILFSKEIFTRRLHALPILLSFPKPRDLRVFVRMLRMALLREAPLLYFSVFVFSFAVNIFATSYVPALKQNDVLDNEIFLITLSNTLTQTLTYFYINKKKFFEQHMIVDTAKLILAIRTGIFLTTSLAILLFRGTALTVINLITYSSLGGAYAFYDPAVSTLIFRTLNSQRQGEILGVYSAFAGLFAFAGAFASGYLSYSIGYPVVFLIAAVLTAVSMLLLNLSAQVGERTKLLHDIVTFE